MKTLSFIAVLSLAAHAQLNTLGSSTLSVAMLATDSQVCLANPSGVQVPSNYQSGSLFFVDEEPFFVTGSPNSPGCFPVIRPDVPTTHALGATIYFGQPNWFYAIDPQPGSSCTISSLYSYPWISLETYAIYTCPSGVWVSNQISSMAFHAQNKKAAKTLAQLRKREQKILSQAEKLDADTRNFWIGLHKSKQ